MLKNTNISHVAINNLCTGCGACQALCPSNSIKITLEEEKGIYNPEVDENRCNNCFLCYKICPGHQLNFSELNKEIFQKQPNNTLLGNYVNCYYGYSNDQNLRFNSSSGGLITQILLFALNDGIIDGALVTKMKKETPLIPEPFIARTEEEIIEASKSKYCPTPVNICLNKILDSKPGEKFAFVGLPCHIHALRKAEKINKDLKRKITLYFGIFCGHTPNFLATTLFLKKQKISPSEIEKFKYRGDGWPGNVEVVTKNERKKIKFSEFWNFAGQSFFYPKRCLMCIDGTAELSDISFGDAWLPEFSNDPKGTSVLISRTETGDN